MHGAGAVTVEHDDLGGAHGEASSREATVLLRPRQVMRRLMRSSVWSRSPRSTGCCPVQALLGELVANAVIHQRAEHAHAQTGDGIVLCLVECAACHYGGFFSAEADAFRVQWACRTVLLQLHAYGGNLEHQAARLVRQVEAEMRPDLSGQGGRLARAVALSVPLVVAD